MTRQRLEAAAQDPANWLIYSGTYDGRRYSKLSDISLENDEMTLRWVFPIDTAQPVETTPLVVDGVMYLTTPDNDVIALNAATGHTIWHFEWPRTKVADILCCGRINRGLAILGETLYMGTLDAHLVAIDARTGQKGWDIAVDDRRLGYTISAAPLVVKDLVFVGTVASQECLGLERDGKRVEVRGHIDAYDAKTGALRWRFFTIPGPGQPGHDTWEKNSWREGRTSAWLTGTYTTTLS